MLIKQYPGPPSRCDLVGLKLKFTFHENYADVAIAPLTTTSMSRRLFTDLFSQLKLKLFDVAEFSRHPKSVFQPYRNMRGSNKPIGKSEFCVNAFFEITSLDCILQNQMNYLFFKTFHSFANYFFSFNNF